MAIIPSNVMNNQENQTSQSGGVLGSLLQLLMSRKNANQPTDQTQAPVGQIQASTGQTQAPVQIPQSVPTTATGQNESNTGLLGNFIRNFRSSPNDPNTPKIGGAVGSLMNVAKMFTNNQQTEKKQAITQTLNDAQSIFAGKGSAQEKKASLLNLRNKMMNYNLDQKTSKMLVDNLDQYISNVSEAKPENVKTEEFNKWFKGLPPERQKEYFEKRFEPGAGGLGSQLGDLIRGEFAGNETAASKVTMAPEIEQRFKQYRGMEKYKDRTDEEILRAMGVK